MAPDISKAFDRVWHAGLFPPLKSCGITGWVFGFILSFLSNIYWFRVLLDGNSLQEYSVNAEFSQGSILGPTFFLLHINDLPDDIICNIATYADDTTLYSNWGGAPDLWQQLKLASELESDLRNNDNWARKWLVDFNAVKTHLVLFEQSNSSNDIDLKMDGSVLEEKSYFKIFGLSFSSKLHWGSYIVSIARSVSKKIGASLCSLKFIFPVFVLYLHKFAIRPY